MTDERALKAFKDMVKDLEHENGLFVGTINPELIKVAISAIELKGELEKEVLDKISAEIDEQWYKAANESYDAADGLERALHIIDKYRGEKDAD